MDHITAYLFVGASAAVIGFVVCAIDWWSEFDKPKRRPISFDGILWSILGSVLCLVVWPIMSFAAIVWITVRVPKTIKWVVARIPKYN